MFENQKFTNKNCTNNPEMTGRSMDVYAHLSTTVFNIMHDYHWTFNTASCIRLLNDVVCYRQGQHSAKATAQARTHGLWLSFLLVSTNAFQ